MDRQSVESSVSWSFLRRRSPQQKLRSYRCSLRQRVNMTRGRNKAHISSDSSPTHSYRLCERARTKISTFSPSSVRHRHRLSRVRLLGLGGYNNQSGRLWPKRILNSHTWWGVVVLLLIVSLCADGRTHQAEEGRQSATRDVGIFIMGV